VKPLQPEAVGLSSTRSLAFNGPGHACHSFNLADACFALCLATSSARAEEGTRAFNAATSEETGATTARGKRVKFTLCASER